MLGEHELQTVDVKSPPHTEVVETNMRSEHDAQVLARMGKKSVLERRFGWISILGFTCTILVTWEGALIVFTAGLTNGGSAGLIYGYLFVWIGTLSVFATMAELASMAPTAAGQYHWVTMLAPPSIRTFVAYITGWLVISGWMAILAGSGFLGGQQIAALATLNNSTYEFQRWQVTLIFWAMVIVAILINTVVASVLPQIESMVLIIHILGFFAILIPIVYLAPEKATAHDVFTAFNNGGEWQTQGLSFFIGLIGNVFAMLGCDSAVHMAEEIKNADLVVPWCMVGTTVLNGAVGFGMIIAVLFVTTNIDDALESATGAIGYPYMDIFYTATGSRGGASVMIAIIIFMTQAGAIAALATSSRLIWSFARDRGLPFWRHISKVHPASSIPVLAVFVASIFSMILGLINIGSTTAFNSIISLSVSSLFASYLLVEVLLLWRRCTGSIRSQHELSPDSSETSPLVWGRYRIPGIFGIINNAFSVLFGMIIFFFSFWPSVKAVEAETMNYSSLMTGFVVLFASFYYIVWARHHFTGPVVEVTPYSVSSQTPVEHETVKS